MKCDRSPPLSGSSSVVPQRPTRRWAGYLCVVLGLQIAVLCATWGQDPRLVNVLLPRYEAWKQARREAALARHQLPLGQPVPALQVKRVAGASVPGLTGHPTVLLFIGQCQG